LTPTEIRTAIARLGLSQVEAARLLGVAPATFRRWLMQPGTPSRLEPPAWLPYALAGMLAGGRLRAMAA
jgi:hypothetical protein